MTRTRKIAHAALSGLLLSSVAPYAFADTPIDNKVVLDSAGNVIRSQKFDTCVRTSWETPNNTDPCAVPAPEPVARYTPPASPARELKKADRTLTFDFDEATLTPDAQAKLDNLASTLKRSGDVRRADIVGFADHIGASDYNMNLSQRRAAAVQSYLTDRGYLNTRIAQTRGLGESRSVTKCESKDSRAALIECLRPDRRVEVEVQFTEPGKASYRPNNYQTNY